MEDFIYASIPKSENAKEFLDTINKKLQSFQRLRKMSYLIIIGECLF